LPPIPKETSASIGFHRFVQGVPVTAFIGTVFNGYKITLEHVSPRILFDSAAKIRSSSCSSAPGKRDKYRYEAECVTDVPIGCILNR
jgi:hypothetical protein